MVDILLAPMATTAFESRLEYSTGMAMNPEITTAEAAHRAKMARKRTKTGCLTCRKRRIKCGEERPVCRNCIKSKRQCEGYSQRVTFRQPTFDNHQPAHPGSNITFQAGLQPGSIIPFGHGYAPTMLDPTGYPVAQSDPGRQFSSIRPDANREMANSRHLPAMHEQPPYPPPPSDYGVPPLPHLATQPPPYTNNFVAPNGVYAMPQQPPAPPIDYPSHSYPQLPPGHEHVADARDRPAVVSTKIESNSYTSPPRSGGADHISPSSTISSRTLPPNGTVVPEVRNQEWLPSQHSSQPEAFRTLESQALPATPLYGYPVAPVATSVTEPPLFPLSDFYDHQQHLLTSDSTNHLLNSAAVEVQDDDYYDVSPDEYEEMDLDVLAVPSIHSELQGNLHRVLQVNNISVQDLQSRRYDTFLYEGILDRYRVEDAANPLKNPATARVFAHFIAVTGPCLSIFERHPRNTSVLFTSGQVPFSKQGLWTYTMPMAALHNQGLLHAMLALASLHIARLQNASDTPSRQHYMWACKRINHLLSANSKRRNKTTTIAASMLLGFYEIFTADHRAWNLHLMGSKQLFLETDFTSLARRFRRLKRERSLRPPNDAYTELPASFIQSQDEILDLIPDIDDAMVSRFAGTTVSYDDPDRAQRQNLGIPTDLDLSNFEILRDLYWWYLKQDAYQSIISGSPLLLDFGLWANCPPRAPCGRADAVYGSFDHLVLLLGRIADFSARDRKRKLRQMEANGGQWRPAPGMKMPGTPAASQTPQHNTPLPTPTSQTGPGSYFPSVPPSVPITQTQTAASTPAPAPPPQFFGMAPAPRQNVQMPSAYLPANHHPAPAPETPYEEPDLKAATTAALEEYGRIRAALREFEDSLGDAFKPLEPEFQPPMDTPFGTALFYRAYDIGCLWSLYHMAVIVAIRSHPHAHPAAHASAAIMAQETFHSANEIGRINAGIAPGPSNQDLNPTLGAALCESCVPSFFAAVQYKSLPQRHATVSRIHNIALRTGWGTAEVIANGCETSWVKAAAAGRGPPYTRILPEANSDDPRMNHSRDSVSNSAASDGKSTPDRSLVRTQADARLTFAIGVMGTEDDEPKP